MMNKHYKSVSILIIAGVSPLKIQDQETTQDGC